MYVLVNASEIRVHECFSCRVLMLNGAHGVIGEQIKEWREKRGLTQQGLAEAAGISVSVVSKLEQGTITDPHWSVVQALANALGVGTDQLRDRPNK